MTRIAVIVPTIGRPSLAATVASIARSGITGESTVHVVVDGPCEPDAAVLLAAGCVGTIGARCHFDWTGARHRDFGGMARNVGLERAGACGAQWAAYLDDDDVYLPGALTAVRAALADRDPTRPELHIFRADMMCEPRVTPGPDGCLWTDRELRVGNIGSCMLVHSLAPLGDVQWRTDCYEHDYRFAADLVAAGYELHWHEDVIARVRPGGGS